MVEDNMGTADSGFCISIRENRIEISELDNKITNGNY